MNNNDKPNTENTSQPENTSQENTSSPSPQPEKEPQPEKVSQTQPQPQPQLVDSPVVRGMDSANAAAAKVLFTRGNKEFIEHVFTDQDTGRKLSYAEMRMMYG